MNDNYYPNKPKSKTLEIVMIAVIGLVVVIAACVGMYFVLDNGSGGGTKVDEYLNIANQFVESKDYKMAIQNYWKAIEVDQYNEKAYIELGGVYETINDYDTAMSVYEMGYQKTSSPALSGLIDNMELVIREGSSNQNLPLVDVPLTISRFALDKLSVYTYERYCQSYGTPSVEMTDAGSCTVSFKGLDATLYYYNTERDSAVIDLTSGTPAATKIPNEISLKNLSLLFGGMTDKMTYDEIASLGVTELKQYYDNTLKKNVVEFRFSGFKAVIECDEQHAISVNSWNRFYPLAEFKDDEAVENCSVSGKVINATTGEGVDAAAVQIYNREDGQYVAEIATDSNGEYTFESIPEGQYTAKIVAEGFIEEDFDIDAYSWDNATARNFTISPELASNEIRIVLEWNDAPRDLDSYLFGTSSKGDDVKVYYMDKVAENSDGQIASLDVDDTDGYGPETTTIYDTNGEYEFVVNDFNRTGQLGVMGATVKIYTGTDSSPIIVEVPSDVQNIWEVCTIKNGQVEVTNCSGDDRPTNSVSK